MTLNYIYCKIHLQHKKKGLKMTKQENKIENLIDYVGDSAYDLICGEFDEQVKDHSFETQRDYAPYGDTEVEVCQYITDEDDEEFREETEKELDVDTIIEKLKEDKHFREAVSDMIKYVVWNREVEV